MDIKNQVYQVLQDIEQAMRELSLWQDIPPAPSAFESTEPFSVDTMSADQWLQWVMLPRMYALLAVNASLPSRFAITPYFEVAFPESTILLVTLQRLDNLLNT